MQPEVGRLVVVDVFKSMALIIVLVLEMLAVPLSCRGVDCNWTQPLFYFEYMSGLFFVIHGLGIGLSVCRQVTSHRTGVMRLVLARSLVMIIAGAICQSAQQWLEQQVPRQRSKPTGTTQDGEGGGQRRSFCEGLSTLRNDINQQTGDWDCEARRALGSVVKSGGQNVLVTATHLAAAFGKLLL